MSRKDIPAFPAEDPAEREQETAMPEEAAALLKAEGIDTLIALTASNEEAQRFYKAVPDSEMRDIGIWIDIL